MPDFIAQLFDSSGFPPRWDCGSWSTTHGWLHIAADSLISSAYLAIGVALWYFARRRADWPFRHLFWLFGAFILACGTTHLMEAVLFWWPGYRLAGALKAVTAAASWVTVAALIPALPRALAMRTPEEPGGEVSRRQAAEAELTRANAELEDRVRERTEQLTQANAALSAERERFRTTLASIGDGVIATDTAGRVTFLNATAEGQTGWQADAAVGRPIPDVFRIVHETTRVPADDAVARVLREGAVVGLTNHKILFGRDGSERHIEELAAPIRDGAGGVAGAVLVFRDVSDRRQAEAVRSEQARLTALRADIASALAASQPKATALKVCCEALIRHLGAAFARIWVLPADGEVLELRASAGLYTHLDGPHSRIRVGEYKIGRIAAARQPHLTNTVADDPEVSDPEWARAEGMVAFAGHPLVVEGRVVGVMALFARHELSLPILADLTPLADGIAQYIDRRRAEEVIRDSEERYRLFFEASPLPMWVYDRDTLAFLQVNAAAVAAYGYTRDEFLSRTVLDIRPPDEVPALLASMAAPDGPDDTSVFRHRLKDGQVIRVRVKTHNLSFRGRPARLVQAEDVTDRLRAEEELRASEERFRQAFDYSGSGMALFALDGRFLRVNAALREFLGYTEAELLATKCENLTHPDDREADKHCVAPLLEGRRNVFSLEKRYVRRDGRSAWCHLTMSLVRDTAGQPAYFVAQFQDIDARRAAADELRASEERFRQAFDYSAIGMALVAPDGRFLRVNAAMQGVFGCPEAALLGTDCVALTAPEDREADKAWVEPMLAGRIVAHTLEKRYLRCDGGTVWVLLTISLVRDADGQPAYFVAQFQDITARRGVEADLRASEGRLRMALEAGQMGTFDWDIGTGRVVWSKSHYEIFGYDGSDPFPVEFRHFSDRIHPDDRVRVEAKVEAAMAAGIEYANEFRLLLPDGSVRWVLGQGRFEFGPDGRAVRMIGIAQDITRRRADEAAVRASEVQYRTLFEMCPDAIYLVDMGGQIRSSNPAAAAITGYTRAELLSMRIQDLDTSDHAAAVPGRLQRLRRGEPLRFEVTHRRKDGTHVDVDVRAAAVEIGGESLVLAFDRDITAERAAAVALATANDLYRLLADRMQDVIAVHDTSPLARYLYVSPSGERLTGYRADELIGRTYVPEAHPDDLPALAQAHGANLRGEVTQTEWRSRHKDGRYVWLETVTTPVIDAAGEVTRLIRTSRDIGLRKEIEDRLRQSQKLEAIGQLAGGVAHDFNNLLTVVNGCSELVLADLPADDPARPLVEDILAAGERGAGLTRQLLAFSRQQMLRTEVFDLSGAIPATASLLGRLLGENILVRLRLDLSAGCVRADLGQVEQIVINLAVNARDAMPNGGTLVIETAPAEVPDAPPWPSPDALPGRYVRLALTDSGTGIAPEVQARLFEPFFTTKPSGKGTGLGLATVYGIVRQSGGFLTVESEVGRGTTFAVYLPRHDDAPDGPKSVPQPAANVGGSETVLLVEDEESVRALATIVLTRQGYRVEVAEDGAAALALCERLSAPPHVVLTDVVMPGMGGRELAETLTARYPRLKVVFLSGYTADDVLRQGIEEERVAFLQKPFTPDSLCRFVRGVLDGIGE